MANAVCAPCAALPSSVDAKPALVAWPLHRPSGYLSRVPDEILSVVLSCLDAKELCVVASVAQRLRKASASEHLWKPLFEAKFGRSKLLDHAHKLAGSWKALYQAKVETALAAQPWRKPCSFELQAALQDMVSPAPRGNPGTTAIATAAAPAPAAATEAADPGGDALRVVFLVDGSGSVGEEDFACMMSFLDTAAQAVAAVPHSKLAVVQFSNDTKVEVALGPLDKPAFDGAIAGMVRMNGGTNIAAAVAKAGALLKAEEPAGPPTSRRVLALLTDGRIDSFQAREASQMVARLADEQSHVSLWAWGVGRGVDAVELKRIIEGAGKACQGLGPERYVELYVRDDAPW